MAGPTATTGPNVVTYLGRTFTSGSAYISIKSLSAYYEGFGYTVGPNFSDLVLTLPSQDVSTQCRGVKTSTRINFADLNWPVPVSAYDCQMPCGYNQQGLTTPSQCGTIWSDSNPLLAIPTQISDLSPSWSSCKIDVPNLGNYWIDPPIALQEQHSVAAPTLPSSPEIVTTPAVPSSTPTNPAASATSVTSLQLLTVLSITKTRFYSTETTSSINGIVTHDSIPSQASDSRESVLFSATESVTEALSFKNDPSGTEVATSDRQIPTPFSLLPEVDTALQPAQVPSSSIPEIATAAGFSVLTKALPSFQDADPTPTASQSIPSAITTSGIIVTLDGSIITATKTSDHFVLDSTAIALGEVVTVSGIEISFNSGGLVVGASTLAVSALPTYTATRTAYVVAGGSFTLAATSVKGDPEAVQIGTATLSVGGPAATVNGQVLTKASSEVVLLGAQTIHVSDRTALPSVVKEKPAEEVIMAAGGHTVTAEILTGDHTAYVISGKTLSRGGDDAVLQNATFTVGAGGLGVVRPQTSRVGTNTTTTTLHIPSVDVSVSSTASRWSSTSGLAPTSTSGGTVEGFGWPWFMLLVGTLICLLCI